MTFDSIGGGGKPLTQGALNSVKTALIVDDASIWALLTVETKSCGFLADRRPKVLFERHIFHKRTAGQYDARDPTISNAQRGGYLGGSAEYGRLARAMELDRRAALESASWGLGQVMGFNASGLGYSSVEEMVQRFCEGEDEQLDGVSRFIAKSDALLKAFQSENWPQVAFFYNGSAYAENGYDSKLARFHDLYNKNVLPDLVLRAAQVRLMYVGFDPHGIDGVLGHGTQSALLAFQHVRGLSETATLDTETETALVTAAGV